MKKSNIRRILKQHPPEGVVDSSTDINELHRPQSTLRMYNVADNKELFDRRLSHECSDRCK